VPCQFWGPSEPTMANAAYLMATTRVIYFPSRGLAIDSSNSSDLIIILIIFFIYFNCACTEPIIPYTQQMDREPQYPAPACTTLLYFNGTPRSKNPIAFTRKVALPYCQPPVWRVHGKGHDGENHCGENPR
jgi:hypothetical protein